MIHNIITALGVIIFTYHCTLVRCQIDGDEDDNFHKICNSSDNSPPSEKNDSFLQENEYGWLYADWNKHDQLNLKWAYNNTLHSLEDPIAHFVIDILSNSDSCYQYILPVNEFNNCTYIYLVKFTNKCFSTHLTIVITALSTDAISLELLDVPSPPKKPTFDAVASPANITKNTMLFYIPRQKWTESKPPQELRILIYIILTETNSVTKSDVDIVDNVIHRGKVLNASTSWIAGEFEHQTTDTRKVFLIGDNAASWSKRLNVTIKNRSLKTNTTYTIITVLINEFKHFQRYSIYKFTTSTEPEGKGFVLQPMYIIMIILVLISLPLLVCCILRLKRDQCTPNDCILCFVFSICISRSSYE